MAVIVKYIVVRNGVEKMTFATKKEADAHDKMLDIADNLYAFLENSDLKLDNKTMEDITLFLAENRDDVLPLLRGMKSKPVKAPKTQGETVPQPGKKRAKPKAEKTTKSKGAASKQ